MIILLQETAILAWLPNPFLVFEASHSHFREKMHKELLKCYNICSGVRFLGIVEVWHFEDYITKHTDNADRYEPLLELFGAGTG